MFELKVGFGAWKGAAIAGIYRAEFDFFHVLSTTPPRLESVQTGTNLTLSWPVTHRGWVLESQTNPRAIGLGTNWAEVVGSRTNTNATVLLNPVAPAVFYRLRYP